MKKSFILPIIVIIGVGCTEQQKPITTILNGNEILNLTSDDNYAVVRADFKKNVDDVFQFPYSIQDYRSIVITKDGTSPIPEYYYEATDPIKQLLNLCFESNNLKISATRYDKEFTSYRIASSPAEIKNCIVAKSNEPMPKSGILILNNSYIYNDFKDNPFLRDRVNAFKSDGVITIKEFMDITQTINKLKDAAESVKYEKTVKDL